MPLSTVTTRRGGVPRVHDLDDRRREPVAVAHAIGHLEGHVRGSEQAQTPHRERTSGRAVRVVIPDHHDARPRLDRGVEQRHRAVEVEEAAGREQARERMVEIVLGADGARREHAAQDGMAAGEEPRIGLGRRAAPDAFHERAPGRRPALVDGIAYGASGRRPGTADGDGCGG